jgi:hypothetical protein
MLAYLRKSFLPSSRPSQKLSARPLLYSTYGGTWVYGSRITYSFMPDGTNVGGISSVLFQTLDAKFSQATWELQFKKAAAVWQAVANINLSQVHDKRQPGSDQRRPAGRPAVWRHSDWHGEPRLRRAGRDVSSPAVQRGDRRRRHVPQLHCELADQQQLRSRNGGNPRVRPRHGAGGVPDHDSLYVRRLQRHKAIVDHR